MNTKLFRVSALSLVALNSLLSVPTSLACNYPCSILAPATGIWMIVGREALGIGVLSSLGYGLYRLGRTRQYCLVIPLLFMFLFALFIYTTPCFRPERLEGLHVCGCFWGLLEGAFGSLFMLMSLLLAIIFLFRRKYMAMSVWLLLSVAAFFTRALISIFLSQSADYEELPLSAPAAQTMPQSQN